jgi:hypothetical protein
MTIHPYYQYNAQPASAKLTQKQLYICKLTANLLSLGFNVESATNKAIESANIVFP